MFEMDTPSDMAGGGLSVGAFAAAGAEGFMASLVGTSLFGNGASGPMIGAAYGVGIGVSGMILIPCSVRTGDVSIISDVLLQALRENFSKLPRSLQDRLRFLCP